MNIELRTKIYENNEHPAVAFTLHNIAQQYDHMNQHQKALENFEKAFSNRFCSENLNLIFFLN